MYAVDAFKRFLLIINFKPLMYICHIHEDQWAFTEKVVFFNKIFQCSFNVSLPLSDVSWTRVSECIDYTQLFNQFSEMEFNGYFNPRVHSNYITGKHFIGTSHYIFLTQLSYHYITMKIKENDYNSYSLLNFHCFPSKNVNVGFLHLLHPS